MRRAGRAVALAAVAAGLALAAAPAAAQGVRLVRIGTFDSPTHVAAPPGDRNRVMVVERPGTVRVVRRGRTLERPFLDVRASVASGGERGLLSIAFAPDYERSRRLYVFYTALDGALTIEELRRSRDDPDRVDPATRRVLLEVPHPATNHNGGQLAFDDDGMLYASFGDGGGGGDPMRNGQRLGTLLGKIIRVDPRPRGGRAYRIPAGNPFVRRAGARDEIWAYGLRNPWRFSFDRRNGDLVIADVGQNLVEEIDFLPGNRGRGANLGWSVFEGRRRFREGRARGHVPPVLERLHSRGWCSIIGGHVVRDRQLGSLYGRYLYGDFCRSRIHSVRLDTPRARGDRATSLSVERLASFGEDARGRVHVASLDGPVYRIARRR